MKTLPLCLGLSIGLLAGCATTPEPVSKEPMAVKKAEPKPMKREEAPVERMMARVKAVAEPERVEEVSAQAKMVTDLLVGSQGVAEYKRTDTTGFPESLLSLQAGRPKPKYEVPVNYSGVPTRGLTADGYTVDLVERDWTGIILTPVLAQVAKAYVGGVQLSNVEVHPLTDGRVRIWVRVRNQKGERVPAEIACSFKRGPQTEVSTMFYKLDLPENGSRDVFFVSPGGDAINYTVLVRRGAKS